MSGQKDATGPVPSGVLSNSADENENSPRTVSAAPAAGNTMSSKQPRSSSPTKRAPTLEELATKLKLGGGSSSTGAEGGADAVTSPASQQGEIGSRGRLGLAGRLAEGGTSDPSGAVEDGSRSPKKGEGQGPLPSLDEIRERLSKKGLTHSKSKSNIGEESAKQDDTTPKDASNFPIAAPLSSTSSKTATASTPKAPPNPRQESSGSVASASHAKQPDISSTPTIGPDGKAVHPLQHKWTLYFDSKTWNPSQAGQSSQQSTPASTPQLGGATPHLPYLTPANSSSGIVPPSPLSPATPAPSNSWEAALKMLGVHSTVESFFGTFSTLRRPSHLEKGSNYHLFKDGIKPMWEDKQNANGGKWTLTLKATNNPALLDRSWMWLVLALIGEELDPENMLTGAVCSVRPKGDRLSIWTRSKEDVEKLNELARRFVSILDLEKEPGVGLEFSYNTGQALPQPNAFWHFYNPPHHGHSHHGLHGGAPTGRQHSAGGFGSPAVNAGVLSPPSGPSRFNSSGSGSSVLRRGSDNPFASTQKLVAPGTSPSKGSSVLGRAGSSDSNAEGPRPVLGSASPVKRGGPLPS